MLYSEKTGVREIELSEDVPFDEDENENGGESRKGEEDRCKEFPILNF